MTVQRLLVIGSGGREGAMVRHLYTSNPKRKIFTAPGNPTTAECGENVAIEPKDIDSLVTFAQKKHVNLTLVGPEAPLVEGVVDTFQEHKLLIWGPTQKAAQLEGSKVWATQFMKQHSIPHPDSYIPRNVDDAVNFLKAKEHAAYTVVKADGLTGGKGGSVCSSIEQAIKETKAMMVNGRFGDAGKQIVLQKREYGPEASIVCAVDKNGSYHMYPLSQDHKALNDGDNGPNTGGMGAYAPADFISERVLADIRKKIIERTIQSMIDMGTPFIGNLYAGVMLTKSGPVVIEYNVRLGDPETQVQLPLIETDLAEIALACISGTLKNLKITHKNASSVCVVLAAPGYPGNVQSGQEVHGLDRLKNHLGVHVIHAGTKHDKNHVIRVHGGRAVNIVGIGRTVQIAHAKVYKAIKDGVADFDGRHYRTDIAHQALNR